MRHHNEMRRSLDRGGRGMERDVEREGRFGRRDRDAVMHREGQRGFGRRGSRGFGRHGEDDGEGRGRRRMFEGGELRLVLLLLMEAEPRHGYDIIREIESRTGGAYAPSPGVVYPTLTLLEEIGQVEARPSEGAKKLYAASPPPGLAHLAANRAEAEAALARIDALGRKDEALDAGPVHRAMSNLKAALRQRLSGEPGKALLFAVADAIDEAARKIERLLRAPAWMLDPQRHRIERIRREPKAATDARLRLDTVTPKMRRIEFASPELADFVQPRRRTTTSRCSSPDPAAPQGVAMRDYTPRAFDAARRR